VTSRRLPFIALIVAALLAVVALVAHGRPLASSGGQASSLPLAFWDYLLTSAIILVAVFWIAMLVAAFFVPKNGRFAPAQTSWKELWFPLVALTTLVVLGFIFRHLHPSNRPQPPASGPPNPATHDSGGGGTVHTLQFRWVEVAIVGGLVLAGVAIALARRSRRRPPPLPILAAPEAVAAALDLSLDDLRADPDLRRSIIAAYARMETALGAAGVPRVPAEAPLEYLERALLGLHTSSPAVRRLTELFEWARFSHHEPDAAMRDDAVDALEAVRDELRAPVKAAA